MRDKILRLISRHMKPCYYYTVAKGPKKDHVYCTAYRGYRNRCKTWQCKRFAPTGWYRIARLLGMVKH